MAHDAFISYATEDRVVANAVCARLEEHGIRCWIAPRDVRAGNFAEQIVCALKGCSLVLLVFSKYSNRSPDVNREIQNACAEGKMVIPFRIENIAPADSLLYYMRGVHWLDALTPPLEAHLQKLVSEVRWWLKAPEPDHPVATTQPVPERRRLPSAIKSQIVVAAITFLIGVGATVGLMTQTSLFGVTATGSMQGLQVSAVTNWTPSQMKGLSPGEQTLIRNFRLRGNTDPEHKTLTREESDFINTLRTDVPLNVPTPKSNDLR